MNLMQNKICVTKIVLTAHKYNVSTRMQIAEYNYISTGMQLQMQHNLLNVTVINTQETHKANVHVWSKSDS